MDEIVETLRRHFRPQEALSRIMSEFFRFHQGKTTLETYAREVEAIGRRAQQGPEEESLIRDKFIDGLESERTFNRLCDITPETMKEAVIRAHEWEHTSSRKTERNGRMMEMPKKLKPFGRDMVGDDGGRGGDKEKCRDCGLNMEAADVQQRAGNVPTARS